MKQTRIRKETKRVARPNDTPEVQEPATSPQLARKGKSLTADVDQLLDEIDDVLEENAEEFVKEYVQRGGE